MEPDDSLLQLNRSGAVVELRSLDGCWEETERRITELATSARPAIHGPAHRCSVALSGAMICKSLPEADLLTVLLFAVTHDACRVPDEDDPEHGRRAADALDALPGDWSDALTPWRRDLLAEACRDHAGGAGRLR